MYFDWSCLGVVWKWVYFLDNWVSDGFTGHLTANHNAFQLAQYLGNSRRQNCRILGAYYLIPVIKKFNIAIWAGWLIGSKLLQIKPLTSVKSKLKRLKDCLMSSMMFASQASIWRRVIFTKKTLIKLFNFPFYALYGLCCFLSMNAQTTMQYYISMPGSYYLPSSALWWLVTNLSVQLPGRPRTVVYCFVQCSRTAIAIQICSLSYWCLFLILIFVWERVSILTENRGVKRSILWWLSFMLANFLVCTFHGCSHLFLR